MNAWLADRPENAVEVGGNVEGVVEAGKDAHSVAVASVSRGKARVRTPCLMRSSVEDAGVDESLGCHTGCGVKLDIDRRAKAVAQNASGKVVIWMSRQPRIGHGKRTLATGQVLSQGASVIEVTLHALRQRIQTGLDCTQILFGKLIARKIATRLALRRERHTRCHSNDLATELTCCHAIKRLKRHIRAEFKRRTTERRWHRVVNEQQRVSLMRIMRGRANIGHT